MLFPSMNINHESNKVFSGLPVHMLWASWRPLLVVKFVSLCKSEARLDVLQK